VQRPWSLRERLDMSTTTENVIIAYRKGVTASSLAAAHGLSLKRVK
jgi:hypothetical protein